MEPINANIVAGAAEALKPVAEEGVEDVIQGLKNRITDLYGYYQNLMPTVDNVAKKPNDEWKPLPPITGHANGPIG